MSAPAGAMYRGIGSRAQWRQLRTAAVAANSYHHRAAPLQAVRTMSSGSSTPPYRAGRTMGGSRTPKRSPVRYASSSATGPLKRTPLYDLHVARGAKMVPYAGFEMPLQYEDLSHIESHKWTREKASLFDVSHMVQHRLTGPGALPLLMKVTPTALDALETNHSTLSCFLDAETGGIIDDTVITRQGPEAFYFVTNASRREADLAFLTAEIEAYRAAHGAESLQWEILDDRALIALQGPLAASLLQPLIDPSQGDANLETLYFGQSRELRLRLADGSTTPQPLLIARTGYTGEDGFEISIPATDNLPERVTETILRAEHPQVVEGGPGPGPAVRLAGLAARDSLRLEAGMCLYGQDITPSQTPASAALAWIVSKDRRDPSSPRSRFNGASIILPQLASPSSLPQRRIGLTIEKGAPAREGALIVPADLLSSSSSPTAAAAVQQHQIGIVTSGLPSPSLGGTNIAMGYIKTGFHKKNTEVAVLVRNKLRKATVTGMPWVQTKFHRPS
ncbi:hypothetical protein VTN31DRAFT_6237 [Thermomyces dupontii]|uniref:uncharacterized protein n=1 Tax=Talaromyces thermophilus TaxID=28565 RepID=UPI0037430A19